MTQGWQTWGRSARGQKRKKTRPQRPLGEATRPVVHETAETPRAAASSGGGWRSAPTRATAVGQTIRPEDYQYVYSDLKRIAVMAAAIFAVLIVLSFIIK